MNEEELKEYKKEKCRVYTNKGMFLGVIKPHIITDTSDRNNIFKVIQIELENEEYDKFDRTIEIKLSDIKSIEKIV